MRYRVLKWIQYVKQVSIHTRYQMFNQTRGISKKAVGQEFWHVIMTILTTVIYMATTKLINKGMKISTLVWSVDACGSSRKKIQKVI